MYGKGNLRCACNERHHMDNRGFCNQGNHVIELVIIIHSLSVFKLQNVSGGLNEDCMTAMAQGEEWKCIFAPVSLLVVTSLIGEPEWSS